MVSEEVVGLAISADDHPLLHPSITFHLNSKIQADMSPTDSPAVMVARFLKANHYVEVKRSRYFMNVTLIRLADLRSFHPRGKS